MKIMNSGAKNILFYNMYSYCNDTLLNCTKHKRKAAYCT